MAIKGFDYKNFAEALSSQAVDLVPAFFQDFQKKYVVSTIKNFATLSGEAIYNDESVNFTAEQAMLITQIIAEWSFHKSVDVIKAGILPEYWDGIMQKVAFTIFEIAKQMISTGAPQDEILQVVEHHVQKSYQGVLEDLKNRNIIDQELFDRATSQSNIDDMMQQIQEDKTTLSDENVSATSSSNINHQENSKILKLASVALLLRQVNQDKVQTILNKFDPKDKQTINTYMQMDDLHKRVDKEIALKCLNDIKINLPKPKFINADKILARMSSIFASVPREKIEQVVINERPNVKEFVTMAYDGDYSQISPKLADIITQHLEESVL